MLSLYMSNEIKTNKMRKQRLIIEGTDLSSNMPFMQIINTSNEFVLAEKYNNISEDYFIKSWTLYNKDGECGNTHPLNAGAYLCETMEELTEMDLA